MAPPKKLPKALPAELELEIANEALWLAMEWGEAWLTPIQERLHALRPELSRSALDGYQSLAQAAMRGGHELVARVLKEQGATAPELASACDERIQEEMPWVSQANRSRLVSQGLYYSYR